MNNPEPLLDTILRYTFTALVWSHAVVYAIVPLAVLAVFCGWLQ